MTITPTEVHLVSTTTKPEESMAGKIVNHVPRLLKERNLSVQDLMFGARLAANTAYRWADESTLPELIDLKLLAKVCEFLGVGVGDIFEFVPDEKE